MGPNIQASEVEQQDQHFSIQFVSRITGINGHTIRAWEKRYRAVVPARDHNGRRLYSQHQVDRLTKLFELTSLGNNISDIANLDDQQLEKMYHTYVHHRSDQTQIAAPEQKNNAPLDINFGLQNLMLALAHFKLDIISHELEKMKISLGPRDFSLSILQPLLVEVASQVDSSMISIAQEHALSAVLKFHVGHMLYQSFNNKVRQDLNIALATPEGELHEFGIMIGSLLCSHYRLKFIYLGSNMPVEALADACKQLGSKILILGISRNFSQNKQPELDEYVQQLTDLLPNQTKIWLGGGRVSQKVKTNQVETISTLQMLDHQLAKI